MSIAFAPPPPVVANECLMPADEEGPFPVRVVHHASRGRELVSTAAAATGDVLLRALPLALVPANAELELRCSACLTQLPAGSSRAPRCVCRSVVCPSCSGSWSRVHARGECVSLQHLWRLLEQAGGGQQDSGAARLLIRLAYLNAEDEAGSCPDGDAFSDTVDDLGELVSHFEELGDVEAAHAYALADTVRRCLLGCARQGRERLARLAATMWCNSFDVVDPMMGTSIGEGIYPSIAMALNHSCAPNCDFHHEPGNAGAMVVRALQPIARGERLTIAYCSLFPSTTQRRAHLQKTYHFHCQCRRCEADDGALHVLPLLAAFQAATAAVRNSANPHSASLRRSAVAAAAALEAAVAPLAAVGAAWCHMTLCRAQYMRLADSGNDSQAAALHRMLAQLLGDSHPWTQDVGLTLRG